MTDTDMQTDTSALPHLKRSMHTRHLVMISLGGAIGTGLFLNSGDVIHQTGAIGSILAYLLGAFIVYLLMLCLGELAVHFPESGSFSAYATRFIGPGTGYVVAWLYWLTWTATLGTEFTAAGILMQHWFPHASVWMWSAGFIALVLVVNIYSARAFAESEFVLSLIKVLAIILFLLVGGAAVFGLITYHVPAAISSPPGIQLWTHEGWFPTGLMPVFWTMLAVNFAYSGTELVGVAAGETVDPKRTIPRAINATVLRLLIFFVGSIGIIAALLPRDQLNLSESPFVTILTHLGIPYTAGLMNLVIIAAQLSTANSGLYAASRMMWTLSDQGMLPRVFGRLTKNGTPYVAISMSMVGGLAALLSSIYAAETVYKYLLAISSLTMVFVWMAIAVCQYLFRRQYVRTGGRVEDLTYRTPLYPWVPIVAFILCLFTGLGALFDPSQRDGVFGCLGFIAFCYIAYFWQERVKARKALA